MDLDTPTRERTSDSLQQSIFPISPLSFFNDDGKGEKKEEDQDICSVCLSPVRFRLKKDSFEFDSRTASGRKAIRTSCKVSLHYSTYLHKDNFMFL
jgi:hypothetical protein